MMISDPLGPPAEAKRTRAEALAMRASPCAAEKSLRVARRLRIASSRPITTLPLKRPPAAPTMRTGLKTSSGSPQSRS